MCRARVVPFPPLGSVGSVSLPLSFISFLLPLSLLREVIRSPECPAQGKYPGQSKHEEKSEAHLPVFVPLQLPFLLPVVLSPPVFFLTTAFHSFSPSEVTFPLPLLIRLHLQPWAVKPKSRSENKRKARNQKSHPPPATFPLSTCFLLPSSRLRKTNK